MRRLLIANRGEIACRIIRTAKRLGWHTIAVFSSADGNAQHCQLADEAHPIGDAEPQHSYLAQDKILALAAQLQVSHIHPGYGFLSENPEFARRCEAAGIAFVGPSGEAIEQMGNKSSAKQLMQAAGVPLLVGYAGEDQRSETLAQEADAIGYPLLVKAAMGGGGRGMRIVSSRAELQDAVDSARREAMTAFGDDRLLLEPYLRHPRHVEVQIMADQHGSVLYFGDRDCSLQRRHQKVVEEAPAPGLPDAARKAMGQAAVAAARAIDYTGAGTVEFLVDDKFDFWFMEMNTRLQVEHPVTEQIFGIDLVEWQLKIAEGEALPWPQDQLAARGHAIELRLTAEDPRHQFVPDSGRLTSVNFPQDPQLRVDAGYVSGDCISTHYDSLLAKLIIFGDDRTAVLRRARELLAQTQISGISSNLALLHLLIGHRSFIDGELTTQFFERHQIESELQQAPNAHIGQAAALLSVLNLRDPPPSPNPASCEADDPWARTTGWRLNDAARYLVQLGDPDGHAVGYQVEAIRWQGKHPRWRIAPLPLAGDSLAGDSKDALPAPSQFEIRCHSDSSLQLFEIDAQIPFKLHWHRSGDRLTISSSTHRYDYQLTDPDHAVDEQSGLERHFDAPMHGTIVSVDASVGDQLQQGDTLLVLEAMKMEYRITAPFAGQVCKLNCQAGDTVERGACLAEMDAADEQAQRNTSAAPAARSEQADPV